MGLRLAITDGCLRKRRLIASGDKQGIQLNSTLKLIFLMDSCPSSGIPSRLKKVLDPQLGKDCFKHD
jgi:hypothetical protein